MVGNGGPLMNRHNLSLIAMVVVLVVISLVMGGR